MMRRFFKFLALSLALMAGTVSAQDTYPSKPITIVVPQAPGSATDTAARILAAAVRLAMADILATDHDGCLPILFDDAFAYTDPERVQSLQRMLNLAALRGLQIIVLTCAPNDYSAFGAAEIRMAQGSESLSPKQIIKI